MIHYRILPNHLKEGSYYAHTLRGERVCVDEIIPRIVGKTTLTAADIRAVLAAFQDEIVEILLAGNVAVVDGIGAFSLSLRGNLDAADAAVTRDNADLRLNARAAKVIKTRVERRARFVREEPVIRQPSIHSFEDIATGEVDRYTAGSIIRLRGNDLTFDAQAPDQGVFIQNGEEAVRLSVYGTHGSRQIEALLPAGMTGALQVTVRTRYTPNGALRTGVYQRRVAPITEG